MFNHIYLFLRWRLDAGREGPVKEKMQHGWFKNEWKGHKLNASSPWKLKITKETDSPLEPSKTAALPTS